MFEQQLTTVVERSCSKQDYFFSYVHIWNFN